jgi:hypothetical protein
MKVEMQRTSLGFAVLTSFLVIIFLIQPIAQFGALEANPISHPFILVESPEHYMVGKVYQDTSVDIAAQIHMGFKQYNFSGLISAFYSLDGNSNNSLTLSNDTYDVMYTATGKMASLTDGYHDLRLFALASNGKELSTSTTFLVNTTFSYPTLLLSPLNISYSKNEVPLTYTINKEAKYVVYYSLDGSFYSSSTPLTSNTTLTRLSEGQHKVIIRVIDLSSIYSENTVYFEVNTAKPEHPLVLGNQTIALGIAIAVIVVVAVASVIFYKRRQRVRDQP